MKNLLFILIVSLVLTACNGSEDQQYILTGSNSDSVHTQSVPSVSVDLHNAGYDTSKYLVIVPKSRQ